MFWWDCRQVWVFPSLQTTVQHHRHWTTWLPPPTSCTVLLPGWRGNYNYPAFPRWGWPARCGLCWNSRTYSGSRGSRRWLQSGGSSCPKWRWTSGCSCPRIVWWEGSTCLLKMNPHPSHIFCQIWLSPLPQPTWNVLLSEKVILKINSYKVYVENNSA